MKARKFLSGTLLLLAATATLAIVSCDKDKNKGGGGTTNNNTPAEDYLTFNGITVKKPNKTRMYVATDTILEWVKNDTFLEIECEMRKAKVFNIAGISDSDKDVSGGFRWGATLNSPVINLKTGKYELKRENGKWVAYITDATGVDFTHGNAAVSGISARLTWPN